MVKGQGGGIFDFLEMLGQLHAKTGVFLGFQLQSHQLRLIFLVFHLLKRTEAYRRLCFLLSVKPYRVSPLIGRSAVTRSEDR